MPRRLRTSARPVLLAAAAAAALSACAQKAVAPPAETIRPGTDTLLLKTADASSAVWLGGGRWAVLSSREGLVDLVDFSSRGTAPLGAKAKDQLKGAASLFRQGDTLFVADWALRRTSLWTLGGDFVRAEPPEAKARGALPGARDAAGQFYLELAPDPGRDGSGNRDSTVLLRRTIAGAIDTIGKLAPLDLAQITAGGAPRFERRIFSGNDRWGVLPDGSLWIARTYQNRVDWRSATGEQVKGKSLPDRVLEVTNYDRQLFLRNFPQELRSRAEQLPFAPLKAPFEAAFPDDAGNVWLEKSRAQTDSARAYHVVDRRGGLAREIRLFGDGRILAVGGGVALAAERVAGAFRLTQIPLPARPAAAP